MDYFLLFLLLYFFVFHSLFQLFMYFSVLKNNYKYLSRILYAIYLNK